MSEPVKKEQQPVVKSKRPRRKRNFVKKVVPKKENGDRPYPKPSLQQRKPYLMKVPKEKASTNSYVCQISTTMCPQAFRLVAAGIASFILEKITTAVSFKSNDLEFNDLWDGLNWMIQGMWKEVSGGEVTLVRRPRIINDLIAALRAKTVNARAGKIAYSWAAELNPALIIPFQAGPVTYWACSAVSSVVAYDDTNLTNNTGTPDDKAWSRILKYLDTQKGTELEPVDSGTKSSLDLDVSTRARAYAYCGLTPCSSAGWALSVENELPIWSPSIAKFADYDVSVEDKRIPTQLAVSSGDACSMVGLKLSGFFGSWYNRACPVFIPIDFEEIYTTLCLWMVKAKNACLSGFNNNNADLVAASLPFSQQDFRIALIQALKGMFGTSYIGQFVGPLGYNQDGNMFIPTTDAGNNYANREFAQKFNIPTLIVENLNALKMRAVQIPKSKHRAVYVPVLGRYYKDVPGAFSFGIGEATTNLFSTPPQESINILDGTMGSVPVNLNNPYYGQVISDWNEHVAAVLPVISETAPMLSDHGPKGLPLIFMTASQSNYTGEAQRILQEKLGRAKLKGHLRSLSKEKKGPSTPLEVIADKYLTNAKPVKQGDGKNVTYLPQASVIEMNLLDTYTLIPEIDAEIAALANTLILPSIRLLSNSDSGDLITSNMFQVHTRFLNTVPYDQWGFGGSQTSYTKLANLATLCITGIGHDSAGAYDRIMKTLQDEGRGAGILSTLAGIVGSIFPGAAPIANMIAGAIEK